MRFVVTELTGYASDTHHLPGLSCMVVDTAWNRRVLATYRSEDQKGGYPSRNHEQQVARARQRADEHAERLNAKYGSEAAA